MFVLVERIVRLRHHVKGELNFLSGMNYISLWWKIANRDHMWLFSEYIITIDITLLYNWQMVFSSKLSQRED